MAAKSKTKRTSDGRAVLDAVMEEWDGVANFVHELREETLKLPKGHANRIKVYLAIFAELMKTDAGGEEATLEEKRRELKELVKEMNAEDLEDLEDDEEP